MIWNTQKEDSNNPRTDHTLSRISLVSHGKCLDSKFSQIDSIRNKHLFESWHFYRFWKSLMFETQCKNNELYKTGAFQILLMMIECWIQFDCHNQYYWFNMPIFQQIVDDRFIMYVITWKQFNNFSLKWFRFSGRLSTETRCICLVACEQWMIQPIRQYMWVSEDKTDETESVTHKCIIKSEFTKAQHKFWLELRFCVFFSMLHDLYGIFRIIFQDAHDSRSPILFSRTLIWVCITCLF